MSDWHGCYDDFWKASRLLIDEAWAAGREVNLYGRCDEYQEESHG